MRNTSREITFSSSGLKDASSLYRKVRAGARVLQTLPSFIAAGSTVHKLLLFPFPLLHLPRLTFQLHNSRLSGVVRGIATRAVGSVLPSHVDLDVGLRSLSIRLDAFHNAAHDPDSDVSENSRDSVY